LKRYEELPDNVKINEGGEDEDGGIEFGDMADDATGDKEEESEEESSSSEDESDESEEEAAKPKHPVKPIQAAVKHSHQQKRGGKEEAFSAEIDEI